MYLFSNLVHSYPPKITELRNIKNLGLIGKEEVKVSLYADDMMVLLLLLLAFSAI